MRKNNLQSEINISKTLVLGTFTKNQVTVTATGNTFIPPNELRAQIEEAWIPFANKGYKSDPLIKIESYTLTADRKLLLKTGVTNYKDFVGTGTIVNLQKYGLKRIANPLSNDNAYVTNDGLLVVGKKLRGLGEGKLVAFGGNVETKDADPVFGAAIRETIEELGITKEQIKEQILLGLTLQIIDGGNIGTVAMFGMKLNVTGEELKKLHAEAKDGNEGNLIFLDPDTLPTKNIAITALNNDTTGIAPDAHLTLTLARKWYKGLPIEKEILSQIGDYEE